MPSLRRVPLILTMAIVWSLAASVAYAQHAAFRVNGRVVTEKGEAVADAEVRIEAFYGFAAGTFAGQRTFTTKTNAKGDWSIGALQPGIWLFEAVAPDYLPETAILPIRILTAVSQGTSGMGLTWDLVLKPVRLSDDVRGLILKQARDAALAGKPDDVRSALQVVPAEADGEYLAGAGRIALLARDIPLARTLFLRALERDPSSYRASLGVASALLYQRDFDKASRAFDATRSRTHDKDEQRFLSAAIADLATVTMR